MNVRGTETELRQKVGWGHAWKRQQHVHSLEAGKQMALLGEWKGQYAGALEGRRPSRRLERGPVWS